MNTVIALVALVAIGWLCTLCYLAGAHSTERTRPKPSVNYDDPQVVADLLAAIKPTQTETDQK